MIKKEIWKDIEGFEDKYSVSNMGEVYTKERYIHRLNRFGTLVIALRVGKNLKKKLRKSGYFFVGLHDYYTIKTESIHRLVAQAFIPNPENKPHVNHKNGVKTDNRVINLEWCTPTENNRHAFKTGLIKPANGERKANAKLTEGKIKKLRKLRKKGWTYSAIAAVLGVDSSTIGYIWRGKSWTHVK